MKFRKFSREKAFFLGFVAIFIVLFGLAGCRRAGRPEAEIYRFADNLRPENVVKSPLLNLLPPELADPLYPVNSSPLADAGANPLGLLREHLAGNVESRILFAPPASEFRFDLTLPRDPVLSFAVGIVRDANSAALMSEPDERSGGVEFIVQLEVDGRHRVIFQKHLRFPIKRDSRTLNYAPFRVDVPAGGRKARLRFITAGPKGAFSLWYSPVLYGRRQTRPNVVLVSIDTLRADHVGAYGYGRDTTPRLDALAAESAVFRNVFASSSWTLPSHVSMLTGLECRRHRVYYEDDRMDPGQPTLAALLKDRGYISAAVTDGGFVSPFYGFFQGFDSYSIGHGELADTRLAARVAEEAQGWIGTNADKPFFLFVHTYQVHHPYHSPDEYTRRYLAPNPKWLTWDFKETHGGWRDRFRPLPEAERQNVIDLYDGEIRCTDEALVGPLVDKLKTLGLYDRTLLIVTSDHGEEFFEHGGWTHTWSLYNESLKVPLVIKFPGKKFAGRKVEEIVRLTDLVPTVLDVLGIDVPAGAFDGRSLGSLLNGREKADRSVFAELAPEVVQYRGAARTAVSSGRDILILNGPFKKENLSFFTVQPPDVPLLELYDLARDPKERINIAEDPAKAEVVRSLASSAAAAAAALKAKDGRKLSKELEDQLRALGYIK